MSQNGDEKRIRSAKDMHTFTIDSKENGKQNELAKTIIGYLMNRIKEQAEKGEFELFLPSNTKERDRIFTAYDWDKSDSLNNKVVENLRELGYHTTFNYDEGLVVNWKKPK